MERKIKTMKYGIRTILAAALIAVSFGNGVQAQTQALQSAAFDNEITAADVTCYTFNSNLTIGSQGGDVMALQIFLAQKGFLTLPAGQTPNINSYFGRLTKAAVAKFQTTIGISPSGYVGPITRGRLNSEFACQEGTTGTGSNGSSNSGSQSSEQSRLKAYAGTKGAAMVVGRPVITLERGINNEETDLVARFDVMVAAPKDKTLSIPETANPVYFEGKANEGGSFNSQRTIVSTKNAALSKNEYNANVYTIAADNIAVLTFVTRVNSKEMFAGPYRARIVENFYTSYDATVSQEREIPVVNANSAVTESVRVMGEVSPYITSASVDSENRFVQVRGVRFPVGSTSKVTVYSSGNALKAFAVNAESRTLISFPTSYLPTTNADYYLITVTDNALGDKAGLSNAVNLNVKGGPVPPDATNGTVSTAVSPSDIKVEGHIVDAGSNYVGYWGVWQPGLGNINKNPNDWHWAVRITSPREVTVKSVTITNGNGEGWSTSDSAKVQGVLTYPLKFRSASQENSGPNAPIKLNAGSNVINFWGQVETPSYLGGTITLTFDDGSTLVANVPASSITQGQTGSTSSNTTNTTPVINLSPISLTKTVQVGQSFSQQFVVDNIPSGKNGAWSSWTVAKGELPSGLTLKMIGAFAGTLSGVPTTAGSYTFLIQAYDPSDNLSSFAWVYLTVLPATVSTSAPVQQPASSIPPQTNPAVTTQVAVQPDSLEAHVVDAGSDYVGIWGNWKPGRGNVNPTNKDWHIAARLITSSAKTIQSITLTNGREGWSTAELQVGGAPTYPLKFMSAFKANSAANERFDIPAGTLVFNVWGQIESPEFTGGTLRVVFTDGSSIAAQVPSSPIKPAVEQVTSATVVNSTITEGIVSASVTSGYPGTRVTLKLAGAKNPTVGDFNFGSYGLVDYSYNSSTSEVSFTVPKDAPAANYDIVWFGPTSSYVVKFTVLAKSTTTSFEFSADELVGSVITVLKSLF